MQLSYIDITIKLALGLLSLVFVINVSGKGNLAPASVSDQVQNYVLGGDNRWCYLQPKHFNFTIY